MTLTKTPLTPRQLEILPAAIRVFAEHGYRAGTLQMVAAEAGLSQAGLIHHFPNKDAILLAVIEHRDQEDGEIIRDIHAEGVSVVEAYRRMLQKNAKRTDVMRLFAVLSAEALSQDHPAHEFFHRRYVATLAATAELVRRNQADGIVRADLPAEEIARIVLAVCDGLRYQVLIGSDTREHWEHLDAVARMVETGDQAGDGTALR